MCTKYVYKRRRVQNSVVLLSNPRKEKVSHLLDCCNSGNDLKFHPLIPSENLTDTEGEQVDALLGKRKSSELVAHDGSTDLNCTSKLEAILIPHSRKEKNASEPHESFFQNCSVNDSCSTSKSSLEQSSILRNAEADDMGECSSADVTVLEPSSDSISSREFCVRILKTNEPHAPSETASGTLLSSNVPGGINADIRLLCITCGFLGNSKSMLICDLCEEAFHLHCCHEKRPFREEWYCRSCSAKNPSPLLDAAMGKSFTISEEYTRRILHKELGPIQFMLKDTQPYTSRVRIGKDYQADIPEFSSSTTEDDDYFFEPPLLNPAECIKLNDLNISRLARLDSIGNWVQCREVIYKKSDKRNSGVICGKWRRAPLFVTQTDYWDCSCAVVWDPIHADCAVPQELETKEVIKQLKFVEMVRSTMDKNQACGRPRR